MITTTTTRRLRIALVSRELAPFYGGGIASYIPNMARALLAAGHEVHVITETYPDLQTRGPATIPGAIFHSPNMNAGRAARQAYPTYTMRYAMATYELLERLSVDAPFDLIEFPDYQGEGYWTIRAKRTRLASEALSQAVMTVRLHSPLWLCREADQDDTMDQNLALVGHCELAALAECDAIVAPSRAVLDRELAELAKGSMLRGPHRPREVVLPLPLDVARIADDLGGIRPTAQTHARAGPLEVLFFGKFQFLKGAHDLVKAGLRLLERGVDVRFRLIGNDSNSGPFARSMLDYMQRKLVPARFAERFLFEKAKPRKELGTIIAAADVCCVPSRWEAYPMVCLESMALGRCVVASDAGGIPEIIENGTSGLLYPAGDIDALAEQLERVLSDTALRQRLGAGALERVRHLTSPAEVATRVEALVNSMDLSRQREVTETPRADARGPAQPLRDLPARRDTPCVSVVIPYFNMHAYADATLDSLRRQTFTDFEVVVVNDGSTDADAIEHLATLETDPGSWPAGFRGLRVVHRLNGGLGAARNTGIAGARTDPYDGLICTLDADDILEPQALELAVAAAHADPAASYVTWLAAYFVNTPGDMADQGNGGWCPLGLDRDLLPVMNTGGCASSLFRVSALRDCSKSPRDPNRPYDEWPTSYEDWDLWCTLAERGHRGIVLPEFLFHYRVRPDSMFRAEAVGRDVPMRSYLMKRHPTLAANPQHSLRAMLGEAALHQQETARLRHEVATLRAQLNGTPPPPAGVEPKLGISYDAEQRAHEIIRENIRYRVADTLNNALKRVGVQSRLKSIAQRVRGK